jgi:hypothetical protein
MVEVGTANGESAEIFVTSGRVKHICCVDRWTKHRKETEPIFDRVHQRFPHIISKMKAESGDAAQRFTNQSLDFVYIDASHSYKNIKRDIELWRPKIKAGGYIGGHDYNFKNVGVVQAVNEIFGNPIHVFEDSSWLVTLPSDTLGIVSYCSLSYLDAFDFTVDSWLQRGRAAEVVIYTDNPKFVERAKPRHNLKIVHAFSPPAEELESFPRARKLHAIRKYYETTVHPHFAYLDCDCWVQDQFREIFANMGDATVAGTELLGNDSRRIDTVGAGVVFFRHHPSLKEFIELWSTRMDKQRVRRRDHYDQRALTQTLREGFDGIQPFKTRFFSARMYNSEHDDNGRWLENVARYQPKILHFKGQRFRQRSLRHEVISRLDP